MLRREDKDVRLDDLDMEEEGEEEAPENEEGVEEPFVGGDGTPSREGTADEGAWCVGKSAADGVLMGISSSSSVPSTSLSPYSSSADVVWSPGSDRACIACRYVRYWS